MTPYRMTQKADCGPAASWAAACTAMPERFGPQGSQIRTYEGWLAAWNWPADEGWLDNANDSPAAHFALFDRLGIVYRILTCADIFEGKGIPDRTLILLHMGDTELQRTLRQHWVTLAWVERSPAGPRVFVHLGNGQVMGFGTEAFEEAYRGGAPTNTAYFVLTQEEVGKLPNVPGKRNSRWHWVSKVYDATIERLVSWWRDSGAQK